MVNIGVLGSGFMGGTHARAYAQMTGVQVVGVSSRSPEKAAKLASEVGAQAFTDPMALINDPHIEAVSNTLPSNLHREYTVAALRAGKHVLVEKPMGLSVADCDAMIGAARQSGKMLMVAHVLRFWPEYVVVTEFLRSGALGKPLRAIATRLAEPPGWADWCTNAEASGGEVLDLHIHDLDTLNWLFGPPRSIYSRGHRGASGGWDMALSLVDYGSTQCFAEGNAMMPRGYPFTMTLLVHCERGTVEFNFRAGGEQVDSRDQAGTSLRVYEPGKPARSLAAPAGDAYALQCAHFVDCVRTGRAPEQGTPEQGRLAVATALAAKQSIETGQVVTL